MVTKQRIFVVFISAIVVTTTADQIFKSTRNQTCGREGDCNTNSFCSIKTNKSEGKCMCKEGYKMDRNTTSYQCLEGKQLGESCETDKMCQILNVLAICKSNKCECDSGSYNNDGQCYLITNLGEICMEDKNCYITDGTLARCAQGRCKCPNGQTPSSDNSLCLTPKKIGESCTHTEECSLVDKITICKEKCVCPNEYTISRDETQCLKVAKQLGDECTEDSQCSINLMESICDNGKCECSPNSVKVTNKCMLKNPGGVNIDDSCNEDAECFNEMYPEMVIKCSGGVCTHYVEKTTLNKENNDNSSAIKLTTVVLFNISCIFFTILLKMYG